MLDIDHFTNSSQGGIAKSLLFQIKLKSLKGGRTGRIKQKVA